MSFGFQHDPASTMNPDFTGSGRDHDKTRLENVQDSSQADVGVAQRTGIERCEFTDS